MQEALQRKAAGDASWWRLREAALTALSTQVSEDMPSAGLDTNSILPSILEHDLRSQDTPPFLRGRALWVAAKLISCTAPRTQGGSPTANKNNVHGYHSEATGETAEMFMSPAIECLGGMHEMVVRVCACRAVAQLVPLIPAVRMQSLLPGAYGALLELMNSADQDVLNLVLVTLHVRTLTISKETRETVNLSCHLQVTIRKPMQHSQNRHAVLSVPRGFCWNLLLWQLPLV
jgi:importin-9